MTSAFRRNDLSIALLSNGLRYLKENIIFSLKKFRLRRVEKELTQGANSEHLHRVSQNL